MYRLEAHAIACNGESSYEHKPVQDVRPCNHATLQHDILPQIEGKWNPLAQRGAFDPATMQPTAVIGPTSTPLPGLFIYENFVTAEEEHTILQGLDTSDVLPWKPARFNGQNMGKRWGVHCNLRDRRVDAPEHPLPTFLQEIILPKLKLLSPMSGCVPNEANAIDYRRARGDWLQAHVDDRKLSKEPIANLSLAGDCYMTFESQGQSRTTNESKTKVLLPRRCLQILTGRARYNFSHGIANEDLVSDRRVSITMRESPLTTRQPEKVRSVREAWKLKNS